MVTWNQTGPTRAKGAAGATGAPGAAGAGGATGEPGASATSLWARLGEDGTLRGDSGVVGVSGKDPYKVQFNRDTTNCGAVATVNAGAFAVAFAEPGKEMFVATTDEEGLAPREFTVVATC